MDSAHPRSVLVLVVLATALANLNVGALNVALPTLRDAFGANAATIQWIPVSYQLTVVGTVILFGRLVDIHGGRKIYLGGVGIFVAASLLAALSPSVLWLIFCRATLGLGAAMLLASGQALLHTAYPREGRGQALGIMHMAVAGGLMAGPSLGGVLVTYLGWRSVFLLPVPVALGALLAGWRRLPAPPRKPSESLDFVGAAIVFSVAVLMVGGLTRLPESGGTILTACILAAAVALGLAFVFVEARQSAPLVDVTILKQWNVSAGMLTAFLTFVALASNMFLIPFALQDVMQYSASRAGLIMIVVPLLILPVAPLAGMLADRRGPFLPATAGLIAIVLSIFGMGLFDATTSAAFAVTMLALYGVGAGLFQAPNNSAVLGAAPVGREGITSGMLALSRNFGQVVGIAVASTVWTWRQAVYEQQTLVTRSDVLTQSLRDSFFVLAGFGVLALLISVVRNA